jgi:NADPH:quinone reductase-like Zn-dependent oxidoreductase
MKAYEIQGGFGLSALRLVERPDPRPGPGELLMEVKASSLNFRDWLMVLGLYNPKQKLPLIPGSDGAGVVVERGAGAQRFAVGTRIASAFAPGWVAGVGTRAKLKTALGGPNDGMLCERIVVPEEGCVELPAHLSFEEGATLPCAAVTAYNALVAQGQLGPGDWVVLQGTGGVSLFGLQFARLCGARVVITSAHDEKLERARSLGAEVGINYRAVPDWSKRVRELTQQLGADHILEVGGPGTLNESLRAVRFGGTVSVIGTLTGNVGEVNLIPVLMQNVRIQGVTVGSRELFEEMNRAIVAHALRPVVDQVFPFDEVPRAFEHLASGGHFGKVCIRVG